MNKRFLYHFVAMLVVVFINISEANIALRIHSKDEGLNEGNISKPRFYIENIGTESVSDFYCYYYFTIENGKTPQIDDYNTPPNASLSLENIGNDTYRVKILFNGATLNPGQVLPNLSGKVLGIHYTDWSSWDKTNDYSNTGTIEFSLNEKIPVYSSSGTLIYGNDMGGGDIQSSNFWAYDTTSETVYSTHKVGIGTTNSGTYNLAVEGKIGAREIVVTTDSWADYVFDSKYELKSIAEVENFINKNKHLEGIPTEKDVKTNGISVGEMSVKLLKKVEELTLYIIDQNKTIEELKEKVEKLDK